MTSPVGSLASEAALLLDAVTSRLQELRPDGAAADGGRPAGAEVCPHCGHDPSVAVTCTACPLCRFLAVVRGERPETTARLVEGALTVVQALRALLPEPAAGGNDGNDGDGDGGADDGPGRRGPGGVGTDEDVDASAETDPAGADRTPDPPSRPIRPATPPDPRGRPAPGALERIVVR